ncbi:putative retrotransposon gag domain, aspartic peptidase domain superfamily [Helianthus annuus]|uniref:Retrotransposon gag domain, aspartic peptidase domain superfamily n=1 Tax=Helianthus annuus TaxID=4232 RepID=A0A9K3HC15_HELAN|nr:putative retrotransposon gag domain, aspartic peptidase domain superfamily [Helianthus annuus]KAJ0849334.1 putative retrotransposon gag domain, aspartic peptidase domain superfamily [Helianthus annuus]
MASSLKNTSTAMSAVNSSNGIPPLPPPPAGSQKNAEKRPTPIFSKPSSSALTSSAPSTSDIFTLILQMRDRMQQQDETNDRILREIGDLKRQKRTAEDHSLLMPKSLNFDTPMVTSQPSEAPDVQHMGGLRGVHVGPAVVTQASGSYFQPAGSYTQHMGSFMNSGSAFVPGLSQFQGSSLVPGLSQVQGSSLVPGSSHIQGSLHIPGSLKNLQTGSPDVHQGDFIPMQSIASTGPSIIPESQQYGFTSNVPNLNPMGGNTFNNSLTTNHGFMQDTGINHAMARELQKLKDMISSVPGVVKPIPEIADGSHKVSRFAPPICDAEIPKRFHIPTMKLYDGTTDPEEHIAQYRERMEINPIPERLKEACLCKGFGSTLTGSALKWLLSLPPYSITSFANLVNLFNNQFSCSRKFERLTSDLYRITQGHNESLRDYITKFSKESLDIPNLDVATAVEAFKMGLLKDSLFYDDLVMTPCRNLDEVRTRALRFIRLEDDKRIQERQVRSSKQEKQGSSFKSNKFKSYNRTDNQNVHAVDQDEDDEDYPPISEYCFSVDNHELILAMQNLGEKARWPRKNDKTAATKDKSKWCAYHEDFGHLTEERIALRKEIGYLLSKGHLKELLGRKKQRTQDPERIPEKAPAPPVNAQVINFISGGSDICGTSFSAAKKHAKEAKMDNGERPIRTSSVSEGKIITFDEDDRINIQDPHHDSLVITLFISNQFVRRILIDGGSSVNIIQLDVLKKMGIPESDITPRSSVLVGFSGETKKTLGDIKLPIYVEGLHNYQKFCVIDCLSCCNVILGRPWIHDMKAVPSTYHQCVKLPSPWGIIKIDSDQQEAKDCYTSSMKPASKSREQ